MAIIKKVTLFSYPEDTNMPDIEGYIHIFTSHNTVYLMLEYDTYDDTERIVNSISLNPHYVEWLENRKSELVEYYYNKFWFKSKEHINGDTKYLSELELEIDKLMSKYPNV